MPEGEVDEDGPSEVEADARPEGLLGRGWEELGLLTRGLWRTTEVVGEEVLGSPADLQLLSGGVPFRRWMRC